MSNEQIAVELTKTISSGDNAPLGSDSSKAKSIVKTYKAILKELNS